MKTTPFSSFLASIAERGFSIIGLSRSGHANPNTEEVVALCHMLLSARGEASGIALSFEILSRYNLLDEQQKTSFFKALGSEFAADPDRAGKAAAAYLSDPTPQNLVAVADSTEPACRELLIRLNQAPDATRYLVDMRADLLDRLKDDPDLQPIDREFVLQFTSWFNRGFLELRNIDWNTPAAILEKIIKYEAVHGMAGWDDLRERIDPEDRMIYGFFHPRLGDEPLIFVEVALMDQMPSSIGSVLDPDRRQVGPGSRTAVFYSISNCQKGLRGIPLGSFLIKQVVEDLRARYPHLREFVTLSPIPTLAGTLRRHKSAAGDTILPDTTLNALTELAKPGCLEDTEVPDRLKQELLSAAQWLLYFEKDKNDRPSDPVARFHLGNGARLERINWQADLSDRGLEDSFGMMANYRYQLDEIEHNHEQFVNDGTIAAATNLIRTARAYENRVRRVHSDDLAGPKSSDSAEIEKTPA